MQRVLAFSALLLAASSVQAIELRAQGAAAYLSGDIRPGDEFVFEKFLAQAPTVRTLYLSSNGGFVLPTLEIARLVRKAGLATAVDASRAKCQSACTGIFVAGVRRHYFNAGAIVEGVQTKGGVGLGFHEANAYSVSGRRSYSGSATAYMINIYYEMGVPGAAELITKSDPRSIYSVSAATAQSLGIATSLSAP